MVQTLVTLNVYLRKAIRKLARTIHLSWYNYGRKGIGSCRIGTNTEII